MIFSNKNINRVILFFTVSILPHLSFAVPLMKGQVSRQVIRTNNHAINKNISSHILKNLKHKRVHARFHTKGQIRKAQQLLLDLGYRPGVVDGLLGFKTRRAIGEFQKNHKLKNDGVLSEGLFQKLLQLNHKK
jgi:hypothetical protein